MNTPIRTIASTAKEAALAGLGKQLRAARKNKGLTQQAVADELNVTAQTVRNWESGKHEPSQDATTAMAAIYGIGQDQLSTVISTTHNPQSPPYNPQKRITIDPVMVAQARKNAGLSQAQASECSRINIASIRRYEQGLARPTGATLTALALVY